MPDGTAAPPAPADEPANPARAKPARPGLSVKGRALRYLSQREHSRAELERKLARHVQDGPDASAEQQIRTALDTLAAAGLLSDRRAAAALVEARARRDGDMKLRHLLRQRGLAADDIEHALAPVAGSELERARELWRRRFGTVAADAAARVRQARFLAGRGFSSDTVQRVVRGLDDDD